MGGVVLLLAAAFSIVRGISDDPKCWAAQKPVLERNRDVIDEVWLSTGCSFVPVEVHRRWAERQAKVAEELRAMGIAPGLQVQATIGHGEQRRGLKKAKHMTWNGFTGEDGYEACQCNCPRDERFREYFRQVARAYAAWKPSSVWIDDDLRLNGHGAVDTGCFCDICLGEFARQEGRTWTREELAKARESYQPVARRWRSFSSLGLAGLAGEIVKAFHEVSPETRFGLQYPWGDGVQCDIMKAMSAACGRKVSIRPGYGAYCDRDPFEQIAKTYRIARQLKMLVDLERYDQICPEIETAPRTFAMRTARGLAFEALIHLAQGCDSLTWYFWQGGNEDPKWGEPASWVGDALFPALRRNMSLYRDYVQVNKGAVPCGFDVPDNAWNCWTSPCLPARYAPSGIPYAPGTGRKLGTVLAAPVNGGCGDGFFRERLRKGVLTDRATAEKFAEKGLIGTNDATVGRHELAGGGRIAVFRSLDPYEANQRTLLEYGEWSDWVARGTHPAIPVTACLAALFPRVQSDGTFASLVVLNTRIDEQAPVTFRIRKFPDEKAVWCPLWGDRVTLEVRRDGPMNDALVTIPALGAWNAGFLAPARSLAGAVAKPGRLETDYLKLNPLANHIQGIAAAPDAMYVTQCGNLHKYDWEGRLLKSVREPNHAGDPAYADGKVYVAFGFNDGPDEGKGLLRVYDGELQLLKERRVEKSMDGCCVFNGVLYCGIGDGSPRKPDHMRTGRVPNSRCVLQAYDPETLEEKGRHAFDLGFETKYFNVQNITTDGKYMYLGFYGQDRKDVPDVLVVDADLKIVRRMRVKSGEGFSFLPDSVTCTAAGRSDGRPRYLRNWTQWAYGRPSHGGIDFFAIGRDGEPVPIASGADVRMPPWEDVSVNAENRLPAHAWLPPGKGYELSLNGTWDFWWCGSPAQVPEDFWKTGYDASGWFRIDVPSCVETRGWGVPHYTNIRYPHPNTPPKIDPACNPVSSYRTRFSVPETWKGRRVVLRFEGVASSCEVWVNGRYVGYSEDSRLPAEFDVTDAIKTGAENLLAVRVRKWCDGSYLEDQDMIRYSGIFRDVKLYSVPKAGAIRDFNLTTSFADGCREATVRLAVDADQPVQAHLIAPDGSAVRASQTSRTSQIFSLPSPSPWSPESPALYTLVLKTATDERRVKVGLRTCEVRGGVILFNGKPVKFKGVNRHEMNPTNGYSVSYAEMEADVRMMKRANFNCVRMSHYPNDPRMYELCDRYGLYVCAEANVESHGSGYLDGGLANKPEWMAAHVERNVRNVLSYRNHPCIALWSLGNEAGAGVCFEKAYAEVKKLDPVTPVHCLGLRKRPNAGPGDCYPCDPDFTASDVTSGMYVSLEALRTFADQPKPHFLCEYACAMGNGMGNLPEYWDVFYLSDKLSGGCIWDWVDQAFWKPTDRLAADGSRQGFLAYGGDHDEQPNDGPFCANGLVDAFRRPSAKLEEARQVQRNLVVTRAADGSFELENRFEFTRADAFAGRWTLQRGGRDVARGEFSVPPVPPRTRGRLAIPTGTGDFIRVSFHLKSASPWADAGYEIAHDQIPLSAPTGEMPVAPVLKEPQVVETEETVTVAFAGTKAVFSRTSGTLCELAMGGKAILKDEAGIVRGPRLQVERAFTDSDNWMRGPFRENGLSQLRHHVRSLKVVDGKVFSFVRVTGAKSGGFDHETVWTFGADGTLEARNTVVPFGVVPELPRMGSFLMLDGALEGLRYYGRGPWENYVDRCAACDVGVWESTVTDQYVDYIRPQDCGGKTDVRWAELFDPKDGRGVRVSSDAPFFLSALHFTHEDLDQVRHRPNEPRRFNPPVPRREVCLSVDCRQTGLGCNNCGPIPLPAYRFKVERTEWTLRLRPVRQP